MFVQNLYVTTLYMTGKIFVYYEIVMSLPRQCMSDMPAGTCLFKWRLWNIHIRGQWLNWEAMKAFIRFLHLFKSMQWNILLRACNFRLVFLQREVTWFSKERLESNFTSNSFSSVLFFNLHFFKSSILAVQLSSDLTKRWETMCT